MPKLQEIKGLKASDRSESDKIYLDTLQGNKEVRNNIEESNIKEDFNSLKYDLNVDVEDKYLSPKAAIAQESLNELGKRQEFYRNSLNDYRKKITGYGRDSYNTTDIRNLADKVSGWYKEFKNSGYVDFSNKEWSELAAQFQATSDTYGTEQAIRTLDGAIQDRVAKNQPWYEQAWNGFRGMGASTAGALIGTAGGIKGAIDYFNGNYEYNEDLNGWDNFINSVLDNEWTRYGNDVTQYGTLDVDRIKYHKGTGISELQIAESREQQDNIISSASPWVALQSGGFTVASMLAGGALAKTAGIVFKGLGTGMKALKAGEALTSGLTKLQKAKIATNAFVIPGLVGTVEGLSEGINTKIQSEKDGLQELQNLHSQEVNNEVNRRLSQYEQVLVNNNNDSNSQEVKYKDKNTGELVDINQIYQQVWDEYLPKYNESLRQIEYASTKAGINNFYANSLINGILNSTLKAGLQAPAVKKALSKTKLFGWAQPKNGFNIEGSGANISVTSSFGKVKTAWNYIKEPLGEFGEEYMQSVSDAVTRGGAENNIHQFIDNKYKGDGSATVGDMFSSDWSAAWSAFKDSFVDTETIKSGVYGALSSIMGTPFLVHSARTGKLNSNGSAETTLFGRGLNERGEKESNWERIRRLTPWRSGLFQSYRENQIRQSQAEDAANTLQEWMRDPSNKDKFDGLVGTFNWAKSMGEAGLGNDEFGYRNSALGKTINDAFMLQKLQGTPYYDSYMNQLVEIANLKEDSDVAVKYIQAMRDNVNFSESEKSDKEILELLKGNANKMLSTLDTIQQKSEDIEGLFGNIDEDTKQSLVYSQLMLKDWHEREKKINEELGRLQINNSENHSSSFTNEQKQIIAEYNSIEEAKKAREKLIKEKEAIDKDIENIKSRKHASFAEKTYLKQKKAVSKSLQKEINRLEAIKKTDENASDVLNEQEIMSLDPISRAIMLRKGKQKTYLTTHGGKEEYNKKIDALNSEIEKLKNEKSKYIKDDGTVKNHHNKQVQKIDNEIAKIKEELDNVKAEEKPFYSDKQQAVIDNLYNQGNQQDSHFLDKIVDLGRIKNSIKTFNEQFQAILSDSSSFNDYVYNAKQSAADIASKKKFQAMSNIQDYPTFAKEMDRMFNESSGREQSLITNAFKDKGYSNYERYVKDRKLLQDLIEQVSISEKHKDMSDNDKEMFAHTITYLSNKGVNFENNQAVIDAVSAVDENGISEFKKYVEEINSTLPEAEQTAFTSIGEALQNFNDVMKNYITEKAQVEANNAPIEVNPVSENENQIVPNPEPENHEVKEKNIFDFASDTPEGAFTTNGKVVTNDDIERDGIENTNSTEASNNLNDIIQDFINNSNEEVAEAAKIAFNIIKNSPKFSDEVKKEVREFIEGLSKYYIENVEEFINYLLSSANIREGESENGIDENAVLLRQIVTKLKSFEVSKKTSVTEKEKPSNTSVLNNLYGKVLNINEQVQVEAEEQSNTTFTSSTNESKEYVSFLYMPYMEQKYPNSPFVSYYNKYNIKNAIKEKVLEGNKKVFFITDDELTEAVKKDMIANHVEYNPTMSLPVVAVIESEDGPITIGSTKYQPIGVMRDTSKQGYGENYMSTIRNAATNNKGKQLITINNTIVRGNIKAHSLDIDYRGDNKVSEITLNDLEQNEKIVLESLDKKQKRSHHLYKRDKNLFLKKLSVALKEGRKVLVYKQPNLIGKYNYIEIRTLPINRSTARDSNKTFEEVANDTNGDIINFNSRTSRAARELKNFLTSFNTSDFVFENFDGQIIPTEGTIKTLEDIKESFQKHVSNFLNISRGWNYKITPTQNTKDGKIIFNLSLVNNFNDDKINLIDFYEGMTEEDIKHCQNDFIKNLILDENSKVRMFDADNSFIKWNTPYSEIGKDSKEALNNLSDIYDDDILTLAATTFNYAIDGIRIENFNSDGTPIIEVTNADNAQSQQPVNKPVIAEGQVNSGNAIVTDEGVKLEGVPTTPKNPIVENTKKIADKITEDSKYIKLADDNSGYIDIRTGKKFPRVTSVIYADERAGERFDPNSPWVTPSTNIGTGFDEFVRDFFSGKLDSMTAEQLAENYPNATKEALQKFREQLMGLRNNFISNGLTIISRDITVTGSLDVLDSKGNIHTVEVAGTLDLLAYDGNGNFYIFDMKTNRSGIDQHKQEKYSRQLSLYKKFLESKYGIQVKSLNLIPIKVDYPAPLGTKNGTADYSISPEKANQLMIDGKNYTGANPVLQDIIAVDYTEPHIVWEKMTNEEKAMFSEVENTVKAETNDEAKPTEATVSKTKILSEDTTLGVSFDDSYLGGMFGLDSTDFYVTNNSYSERTLPIPSKLQWQNLEQSQRDILSNNKGYNEALWSSLTDDEMQHELDCL